MSQPPYVSCGKVQVIDEAKQGPLPANSHFLYVHVRIGAWVNDWLKAVIECINQVGGFEQAFSYELAFPFTCFGLWQ
jgi:hypothetical protein